MKSIVVFMVKNKNGKCLLDRLFHLISSFCNKKGRENNTRNVCIYVYKLSYIMMKNNKRTEKACLFIHKWSFHFVIVQ